MLHTILSHVEVSQAVTRNKVNFSQFVTVNTDFLNIVQLLTTKNLKTVVSYVSFIHVPNIVAHHHICLTLCQLSANSIESFQLIWFIDDGQYE